MALVTDGVLSFVNLLYLNSERQKWSAGVQMGLSSGIKTSSPPLSNFMLPDAPPGGDSIWSNTDIPGDWFFRVDTAAVLQPQRMCSYSHILKQPNNESSYIVLV